MDDLSEGVGEITIEEEDNIVAKPAVKKFSPGDAIEQMETDGDEAVKKSKTQKKKEKKALGQKSQEASSLFN
jgi:hypothetical protein